MSPHRFISLTSQSLNRLKLYWTTVCDIQ